ncbi:MAG: type II toxin-antitoxin system VapC family toxin [Mycobacterium sp.]|uniref:type II toxin-antitoxin system VapC family toxin n=2 Tax=Mycobacterium sp. TaxID=1785 RepID=UPI003F9945A5
MILLDTNVLSALMRREPDRAVVAWLDDQPGESIWTTTITILEVRTGIELLEQGRRRRQLEQAFGELLTEDLGGRVQPFDQPAALAAASIAAARQRAGRPVEIRDVQIAGIATARRATLATRNTRHFDAVGVNVVDPWSQ